MILKGFYVLLCSLLLWTFSVDLQASDEELWISLPPNFVYAKVGIDNYNLNNKFNQGIEANNGIFTFAADASRIFYLSNSSASLVEANLSLNTKLGTRNLPGATFIVADSSDNVYAIIDGGNLLARSNPDGELYPFDTTTISSFMSLAISCNYVYAANNQGDLIRYPLNSLSSKEYGSDAFGVPVSIFFVGGRLYILGRDGDLYYLEENNFNVTPNQVSIYNPPSEDLSFTELTGYAVSSQNHRLYSICSSGGCNTGAIHEFDITIDYYTTQTQVISNPSGIGQIKILAPLNCGGGGSSPACSDNKDNDNDGLIDYPQDPGCASNLDNDETNQNSGDYCPNDPNKTTPGKCGCGVEENDADTDSDGKLDCVDNCALDPNKIEPGDCGCGKSEKDNDGDNTPNCVDECPFNPDRTEANYNCCTLEEIATDDTNYCACVQKYDDLTDTCQILDENSDDQDGDGYSNSEDSCPTDPFKWSTEGNCGCGLYEDFTTGSLLCESSISFSTKLSLPKPKTSSTIKGNFIESEVFLANVIAPKDRIEVKREILSAKSKKKNSKKNGAGKKTSYRYTLYSEVTYELVELSGGQATVVKKQIKKVSSKRNSVTFKNQVKNPTNILIRTKERKLLVETKTTKNSSGSPVKSTKTYSTPTSLITIKRPL